MINLSDTLGINISYDESTGKIVFDSTIKWKEQQEIKITDMIPVLLNKFLKYPEQVYMQHIGLSDCVETQKIENVRYDICEMPSGLLGIEYVKSHIYYTNDEVGKHSCLLEVAKGEVMIITQKNEIASDPFSFNTHVDDVNIIRVSEGDRLAIPSGVFFSFINIGSERAIITIISQNLSHVNYNRLAKEKGLAYFVICKNARLEIVANPRYKVDSPPKKFIWRKVSNAKKSDFVNEFIEREEPMYEFIKNSLNQLAHVLV